MSSPASDLAVMWIQVFTVGDSRADVWIVNSGIYVDDAEYMTSPNAKPGDKVLGQIAFNASCDVEPVRSGLHNIK